MNSYTAQVNASRLKMSEESAKRDALRATIADELQASHEVTLAEQNIIGNLTLEMLRDNGIEALSNVDTAEIVYQVGWSKGSGFKGWNEAVLSVFNLKMVDLGLWVVSNRDKDFNESLKLFKIMIPSTATMAELENIQEKLEPIFKTQLTLFNEMYIEIEQNQSDRGEYYEENSYNTITFNENTQEYQVGETISSHKDFRSVSFLKVLNYVKENLSYDFSK